jgi:hypothetical protein
MNNQFSGECYIFVVNENDKVEVKLLYDLYIDFKHDYSTFVYDFKNKKIAIEPLEIYEEDKDYSKYIGFGNHNYIITNYDCELYGDIDTLNIEDRYNYINSYDVMPTNKLSFMQLEEVTPTSASADIYEYTCNKCYPYKYEKMYALNVDNAFINNFLIKCNE